MLERTFSFENEKEMLEFFIQKEREGKNPWINRSYKFKRFYVTYDK